MPNTRQQAVIDPDEIRFCLDPVVLRRTAFPDVHTIVCIGGEYSVLSG